jgi:hypothetical protein
MEFRHDLAAGATWADRNIGGRDHGDATKRPLARRHSGSDGHALGAHGEAEAEILDIAAGENGAVLALKGSADGEVRVGRVGIRAGEHGGLDESGVFHAG